ncbi:hypothetical protein [Nocardioides sp. Root190]|nr:hypothetical protein [Nocardioides sp. Root190]
MNTDEREGWDDWTREVGFGLVLLVASPVLAAGLAAWFVARALGLSTP